MRGYFRIGFIDFMLAGKNLTVFTNIFLIKQIKKPDIVLNCFMTNV